jgi:hypothetical protein
MESHEKQDWQTAGCLKIRQKENGKGYELRAADGLQEWLNSLPKDPKGKFRVLYKGKVIA